MSNETGTATNKLRRNSIGLALLTFMVISAASPLTGVAGAIPIAMLLGNGAGIPGTFIIMAIVMLIWAVGFVTLARYIKNAGAFYAYSARALGGKVGGAVAMIALLSYNAMSFALMGLFGGIAASVFSGFGIDLPWYVWSIIGIALIGFLGYRQVELSAKILFVLVSLECLVALVVDFAILKQGGAGQLSYNIFDPALLFSGSAGAAIIFTFGSFIGIEASAIYAEEVRNPERTVPQATYLSVVVIAGFYAFTTWLMVAATGVEKLVPTIGGMPDPTAYFFEIAGQYAGGPVATAAGLLLVTSIFASASAMHNFIARYFYVAGREGLLPSFLGVTHGMHQSPHAGSLTQTVMVVVVVLLFAIFGLDPILTLFTWVAQISVFGVLVMMAITSFAVVAFFRAHKTPESAFKTIIAPLVSGVAMTLMAAYVYYNFGPSTGTEAPLSIIFPSLVALFGVIGYAVSARLEVRDPKRFEAMGANDWATGNPVD